MRGRDRRRAAAGEAARASFRARHAVAAAGSERRPGVVRHLARPDEVPESRERLLGLELRGGEQVEPELGAAGQHLADPVVLGSFGRIRGRELPQNRCVLAEVDRHAVEPGPDPDELTCRAQLVELGGLVVGHAPRENLALPEQNGKRQRLERNERVAEARAPVDPVPAGQEPPEGRRLRGLDLLAKRRKRGATQATQHVRVAPLTLAPARPELPADEPLLPLELPQ